MTGSVFTSAQFAAYAAAIRRSESSDNYSAVNDSNHLGAYQLGPKALQQAGFQDADGNWTSLAKGLGANSQASFLSSQTAQDTAFQNFTQKNFSYLQNFQSYVGKTVDGIPVTESGLLAAAHLVGEADVKKYLNSDGKIIPKDGNKTPIYKVYERVLDICFYISELVGIFCRR